MNLQLRYYNIFFTEVGFIYLYFDYEARSRRCRIRVLYLGMLSVTRLPGAHLVLVGKTDAEYSQ